MIGWFYRALERHLRSKPAKLAARLKYVPPWLVDGIARAKLARVLARVWDSSPVQRERWQAAGVRRRDLRDPSVLPRIPFFDPMLLQERPEACFCAPSDDMRHLIHTAGTTGKPKRIYLTSDDLRHQTRMMGMHLATLEGASRLLILFYLRGPTWTAGPMGARAAEEAGLFALTCDHDRPSAEVIDLIHAHRIDSLLTSMSVIQKVTHQAGCDPKSLGVKYILLATQAWPESSRAEIESAWGATVLDIYGLMEFGSAVAAECRLKRGLHVATPDFWVEVVDPDSGAPVSDGTYGEIVLTTLSRRGVPIVRYRTHDHACLLSEDGRCACGTPTRRISRIRGRLDRLLVLGPGVNVPPDRFDTALLGVPGVSDYQLAVDRDGYADVLDLTVESDEPIETLREKLKESLLKIPVVKRSIEERQMMAFGEFRVVPRGTLSAGRPKSVRIIDRRTSADDYARPV